MVQEQETPVAVAAPSTENETTTTTVVKESPVKTAGSSTSAEAPQSSSSSSPTTDKEENLKKAMNALTQGKRHYLMKDAVLACSALGEACRLFTEVYGPIAFEHAESHFFYGKALLDQARAELAVFEAPPAGAETKSDEEDTEESVDEDEEEEEEEGAEKVEKSEEKKEEEADTSKAEAAEDKKDETLGNSTVGEEDLNVPSPAAAEAAENGSAAMETDVDAEKPSTSKGVAEADDSAVEAEAGDDLSSLELAWEVLEIAKLGYTKQIESLEDKLKVGSEDREDVLKLVKQFKQRLAETNSLLGEVGTESENYPQAIDDFKTALEMYSQFESPDSRDIAQVHFHIGVAYGLAKAFQESMESFKHSVSIIRSRIENLKKSLEDKTVDAASLPSVQSEVQELTELLPELEERITDTLEQEKEAMRTAEEDKMEEEVIQRNSPVKNPNPPAANDISHLVKKRKKVEEPTPETEPEAKKPKACSNLAFENNGAATTTTAPAPTTNGHSKPEEPAVASKE